VNYAIGGYFELTLPERAEWHGRLHKLNSARNALRYYLSRKKIKQIFLPHLICNSLINALQKDAIDISYYDLDEQLQPVIPAGVHAKKPLLVVNYFGLNIAESVGTEQIVVDNSQAFFLKPSRGKAAIYSPRKFFGLADGGYLYSPGIHKVALQQSLSWNHYQAPLMRIELPAKNGLPAFRTNEERIASEPIAAMSVLTSRLLSSIDYDECRIRREKNFALLHTRLRPLNRLPIQDAEPIGPMVYPFLAGFSGLTEWLRKQHIFCATYWPEVTARVDSRSWEAHLVKRITALPVDHRWTDADMSHICRTVEAFVIAAAKNSIPERGETNA